MIIPVGSSAKKELLCVYTWWLTSTSGNVSSQTRRLDYQGPHYSNYIDDSGSSSITILKDCKVEISASVRIANNTRRNQTFVIAFTSGNTRKSFDVIDNNGPATTTRFVFSFPNELKANDYLSFSGTNANATATVRTVAIWAYV